MKILCLVLSMYVVLLAANPCCADKDCQINIKIEQTGKRLPNKECSGCSPFFTCGSCAGFVVAKSFAFGLDFLPQLQKKNYADYDAPFHRDIILSIWQPPQLS